MWRKVQCRNRTVQRTVGSNCQFTAVLDLSNVQHSYRSKIGLICYEHKPLDQLCCCPLRTSKRCLKNLNQSSQPQQQSANSPFLTCPWFCKKPTILSCIIPVKQPSFGTPSFSSSLQRKSYVAIQWSLIQSRVMTSEAGNNSIKSMWPNFLIILELFCILLQPKNVQRFFQLWWSPHLSRNIFVMTFPDQELLYARKIVWQRSEHGSSSWNFTSFASTRKYEWRTRISIWDQFLFQVPTT